MTARARVRRATPGASRNVRRKAEARPARGRPAGRRWLVVGTVALAAWTVTSLGVLLAWASFSGPGEGKRIEVDWPADAVAPAAAGQRLTELGLVRSPHLFAWYLRLSGARLEPGPHVLHDALSPRELVQRLARLSARPSVRVNFPEGWNHLQIAERLDREQICSAASFRAAVVDPALRAELAIPGSSLEGYLFPASYELGLDSDPRHVARLFVREMKKRLAKLDSEQGGALARVLRERGMDQHQLVILASIVEKEARAPDERPTIASVFYNRLSDPDFTPKGSLQSDPTAVYGCTAFPDQAPSCKGFTGLVTPAMLRDAQNRYNTYRHPGLPPGPIANPGEAALTAVLAPAKTDFLFFVSRGDGRHSFSRNFADHNAAVERLRAVQE